jgi:outer membrane protein TolC
VRAALRDVQASRARTEAGKIEVAAAAEGLEGERQRLKQDRSTPFRVLEKEEALTDARTREGRAAADLRIAQARFAWALGMLGPTLGVALPCPR